MVLLDMHKIIYYTHIYMNKSNYQCLQERYAFQNMNITGQMQQNEETIYGSAFAPVDYLTPYYERTITAPIITPWLARDYDEATYMNRIKERNEEPVLTYRELKLTSIPEGNQEMIEGFGNSY